MYISQSMVSCKPILTQLILGGLLVIMLTPFQNNRSETPSLGFWWNLPMVDSPSEISTVVLWRTNDHFTEEITEVLGEKPRPNAAQNQKRIVELLEASRGARGAHGQGVGVAIWENSIA